MLHIEKLKSGTLPKSTVVYYIFRDYVKYIVDYIFRASTIGMYRSLVSGMWCVTPHIMTGESELTVSLCVTFTL